MKKMLLLSLMGLFLFSGSLMAAGSYSAPAKAPGPWINIKIIFHKRSTECQYGFGLCVMLSAGWGEKTLSTEKPACGARISLNEKNQLILEVKEDELLTYERGGTLPYFKGKEFITLEESYLLPADISRSLGASSPLQIKPGIYPVKFLDGIYTVVIQL
jgi:hypothetical protein